MPESDAPPKAAPAPPVSGAIAEESVLAASTADLPSEEDSLGFEPYVQALAEFLLNPSTHGPLTISVEGEWGSGKSSFMLQLEERLIEMGSAAGHQRRRIPLTVRFNAWRHDKDEALWAAFATEFTRRIALQQSVLRRWWGHLLLVWRRFSWREGWLDLLRAIVLWTAVIVLVTGLFALLWLKGADTLTQYAKDLSKPSDKPAQVADLLNKKWVQTGLQRAPWLGGVLAYLALLMAGLIKLKQYVGNPLAIDLKKYLDRPNYPSRISFVEKFHEDFSKIVDAYAGDKTVYVFIDDLDRCEVPKAAELMQALNLMMSTDRRGLIFIIGMDREKVAAGLAVKNEKLLPYLFAAEAGQKGDVGKIDPQLGLAFGYNFIEKFIQIPFLVPSPAPTNLGIFFDKLAKAEASVPPDPLATRIRDAITEYVLGQQERILRALRRKQIAAETQAPAPGATPGGGSTPAPTTAAVERRERLKLKVTGDSPAVRNIVLAVAPALDNNPRRLKQFVNLFRLRTFIAAETGLFDGDDGLWLEQLGKFVALNLRWPLLLADLERDPHLLQNLTRVAVGLNVNAVELGDAGHRWSSDRVLQTLLRSRVAPPGEEEKPSEKVTQDVLASAPWSMASIDVHKLLRVSPRVHTIVLDEAATTRPGVAVSKVVASAVAEESPTQGVAVLFSEPAARTSESSGEGVADVPTESPTAPRRKPHSRSASPRVHVALAGDPGDSAELKRLEARLAPVGIDATIVEGRLAGSNLVVKLAPRTQDDLIVLFCVGINSVKLADDAEYIARAMGEDRIPVILASVEGGFLNSAFGGRIYFDLREPDGFERLTAYLLGESYARSNTAAT